MDGDGGTLREVTVSQESIEARLWFKRYHYGLSLLGIKKSETNDKIYERQFDLYHSEKALESALWQAADAARMDSPSVVYRAVEKAKVFDTIENFEAVHRQLVLSIRLSVWIAVIGSLIVQPPSALVIPFGLVAYVLTARFFNLPSARLAYINLALYVVIFGVLLYIAQLA